MSYLAKEVKRGVWDLNPRGLSTTDLAGLPPTRLGQPRLIRYGQLLNTLVALVFFVFSPVLLSPAERNHFSKTVADSLNE
jgi:hypothetical protein